MEAFGTTFSFSRRSGGWGRRAQLHQKAQSRSLHLSRGSLAGWPVGSLGIPGRGRNIHRFPHQQELPEGQRAQPHPMIGGDGLGGLIGIQAQMLFEKPKSVFDSEAPKIHAAQVFERHRLGAGPEQPHRALVTRGAIRAKKLNAQDQPDQLRQLLQVQASQAFNTIVR